MNLYKTPANLRAGLLTATIFILFILAIIGIVYGSNHINLNLGISTQQGSTRIALDVIIWGAYIFNCLLIVSLYCLIHDLLRYVRPINSLYAPVISLSAFFSAYLNILAAQAWDILHNHLKRTTGVLFDPDLRVIQNFFLIGVFAAAFGLVALIVRGRGWSRGTSVFFGILILGGVILVTKVVMVT